MAAEAPQFPARTPEELGAQKRRNVWLALMLVAFLVLAFVITITRIRDGIYWSMPDHSSDVVSMPDPDFVPFEEREAESDAVTGAVGESEAVPTESAPAETAPSEIDGSESDDE
ncbi:MAG: hypothetical protein AAGJ85_08190 [Pseudomonadota bacterium]